MSKRKRFLVDELPSHHQSVSLSKDEADHAQKVMRLRDEDLVEAINGNGQCVVARIKRQGNRTLLRFVEEISSEIQDTLPITVAMAVIKGDAMEWTIEKCVELGVKTFIPLTSDRSVVKIKNKGPIVFQTRWKKIADQSLKQCQRLTRMDVEPPQDFSTWLKDKVAPNQTVLWCNEESETPSSIPDALGSIKNKEVIVLIGPEGGWSEDEVAMLRGDQRMREVTLGPLVLRAETAALFAVSVISSSLRFNT